MEAPAALRGDMQSALSHQRQQANGFERNRFSTCVRSGDDKSACSGLWINVNGHDGVGIEQWMAGMEKIDR